MGHLLLLSLVTAVTCCCCNIAAAVQIRATDCLGLVPKVGMNLSGLTRKHIKTLHCRYAGCQRRALCVANPRGRQSFP